MHGSRIRLEGTRKKRSFETRGHETLAFVDCKHTAISDQAGFCFANEIRPGNAWTDAASKIAYIKNEARPLPG